MACDTQRRHNTQSIPHFFSVRCAHAVMHNSCRPTPEVQQTHPHQPIVLLSSESESESYRAKEKPKARVQAIGSQKEGKAYS